MEQHPTIPLKENRCTSATQSILAEARTAVVFTSTLRNLLEAHQTEYH